LSIQVLNATTAGAEYTGEKLKIDEQSFRFSMNSDAMATEKLAEGIRYIMILFTLKKFLRVGYKIYLNTVKRRQYKYKMKSNQQANK
jgi:hypothetical protein